MTTTRKKRPRDPVQLGKLIVDIATGQTEDRDGNILDAEMSERKRRGGRQGGAARSRSLTSTERSEIARVAAEARWRKTDG